jgi:predicted membrane protein
MTERHDDPARRGSGDVRPDLDTCCPDCGSWKHSRCGDGRRSFGLGSAIIGFGILAAGAILLLDNFGMAEAEDFFSYWPVLLVLVGVSHFFRPKGSRSIVSGLIWIGIGCTILFNNLGYISFDIWNLWPVVLVMVGLSLILKPFRRRGMTIAEDTGVFEATASLGGANRRLSAANFQGGDAIAIMGGCDIDLRDCGSEGGPAEINTFAFWGGIEIKVPQDWEVQVRGIAILGGYDNSSRSLEGDGHKVLVITGTAIMGGVDIKN